MRVDLESAILVVSDRSGARIVDERGVYKGLLCPWVLTGAQCRAKQPAAICVAVGEFAKDELRVVQSRAEDYWGRSATADCVKVHEFTTKPFRIEPHRYGIARSLRVHASPETNSDTIANRSPLSSGVPQHVKHISSQRLCVCIVARRQCQGSLATIDLSVWPSNCALQICMLVNAQQKIIFLALGMPY
jgi:hypothetical protein